MVGVERILAIRSRLREIAGGKDYAFLNRAQAFEAITLLEELVGEVPTEIGTQYALGTTVVGLSPMDMRGNRIIWFTSDGGGNPAWAGYPNGPRYFIESGFRVRVVPWHIPPGWKPYKN